MSENRWHQMKKPSFLPVTATIMGILLVVSFCYSLKPVANADSSGTEWKLTVTGLVAHPLNLTLSDIVAMPQTTIYAQLICVGPPSFKVTEGNWTGVKLGLLLEETGVSPATVKVAFYAQDGYTTDLTVDTAQRDDVILAYEKDGVPLSDAPRLVVPGHWGYKWIAQLIRVELVDYNFLGKFERQGYSDEANIQSGGTTLPPVPYVPPSSNLPPSSPSSPSSPSPSLTPSPSPNSSRPSSSVPSQNQNTQSGSFLPMDSLYAIAAVIAIIVVAAVAAVLKKRPKSNH